MSNSCVWIPQKGVATFVRLKQEFGYEKAASIFNKIITSAFIDDYRDSLTLDSEGVPTYSSLIKLPIIKEFIGEKEVIASMNRSMPHVENTRDAAADLINRAIDMNNNPEYSDYVAYVDYDEDGKLTIKIDTKNRETLSIAENQAKIQKLNEKVVEILSPVGVTMEHLSDVEVAVGRVGVTNFNHAKEIADSFGGLIRLANNMEGFMAMSEEFSHLLVGIYRNTPLMQRTIAFLSNEENAKRVLGNEYDKVKKFYNDNMALVAEEAAGQMLRDEFLKRMGDDTQKPTLLVRTANFIKSLFRPINPGYYQNSIDNVAVELGNFARKVLEGKKTITRKSIRESKRDAEFNALSERADVQIEKIKGIVERAFKASYLQENLKDKKEGELTEKGKARRFAEEVNKAVNQQLNKEESMAAIAAYLEYAKSHIDDLFTRLGEANNYSLEDKFRILRNAFYAIQQYKPTLEDLREITTQEFLEDEGVSSQNFMVDDSQDVLTEFEGPEVEQGDSSGMSTEDIAEKIEQDSSEFVLSDDEEYYIDKSGNKYKRVTSVISSDPEERSSFDPESPWTVPSTNIGTGIDELTRDFIAGKIVRDGKTYKINGKSLEEVYPNASKKQLNAFVAQLDKLKQDIENQGITLIPRDVTVNGTIRTVDSLKRIHTVRVAGTLDLLGYDADGNWYIYDMKTHRGELNNEKKKHYARQVSLYKQLLEKKYGITIKNLSIIPIKVSYPTPEGATESASAKYKVSSVKPEDYSGRKGNQLILDGSAYKDAKPFLEEIFDVDEVEVSPEYKKLSGDLTGGLGNGGEAVINGINAITGLVSTLEARFWEITAKDFIEFLKPFVGENLEILNPKTNQLEEVSISYLIEHASSDVTYLQRWLSSMADNPNALLQMFDKVVKIVKDKKALMVAKKAKEILALGKEYELRGVKDYSKFFEGDKQRYISHIIIDGKDYSYDNYAYEQAKAAFIKELNNIYGEFPEIGSEDHKNKNAELQQWIKSNTEQVIINGKETAIPNHEKYPSSYNNLSETEKEFYDKWMAIKEELDALLSPDSTFLTNTIKIRKNTIERVKDVFSENAIESFVEEVKSRTLKSFDDDLNYYASGIRGFNNEEIMKLPLYYVHAKDASDITTDMIGSLVAYAEMAYNYDAMNGVLDPLELGKELVYNKIQIGATRGGKILRETYTFGGKTITNPIMENTQASYFRALLNDFFSSKIYGRYLQDSGEIGNTGIDKNKVAGLFLKLGSTVQLGFNFFAWSANVLTGISMQNIEAAVGEFFTARELLKADGEFAKEMGSFVGDIGQRIKTSKLHLFDEMFDVRQNFRQQNNNKEFNNRNILLRIFGPGFQYFGQDAGDHWLYNRTAIAMALRYKLKDTNGNSISLWDALEVVPLNKEHPEYGTELKLKDGVTKEDGTEFTDRDISDLRGRMRYVNQHLFGIYNEEDAVAARRTIVGRFLLQYRDWIPAQIRYRFGAKASNLEKGGEVEGYYRTTGRFFSRLYKELKVGQLHIPQIWNELSDYEKKNVKRASVEFLQWAIIALIAGGLKDGDGDDPWLKRTLRYLAIRERTELGALIPFSMPKEMLQIAKSPFANTSVISDLTNLRMCLWPSNWTDEIKSGDYKGHSSGYRAFMRSPLTLWYRTIKRTFKPEKAAQFYNSNR